MGEPFDAAAVCDTCGSRQLEAWLVRADGIKVLLCAGCGTGVVERLPGDLDAIYQGGYYARNPADGMGYSDYAFTAEHSVGWAAALVDVLCPSGGAALDIGCADGLLLAKLGPSFGRRAGVEMNHAMAEICRERGLEVLANDIYDPALEQHAGAFDIVTAIAVFEHVPQFARAVRCAIDMARPDGLLLFEVPLMSDTRSNDVWLSSSLEHLYYPTARSLAYLFENTLGVDLHGGELHIRGYGSTFLGLASRNPDVAVVAQATVSRLISAAAPLDLDPMERRARVHLHLLHAARTDRAEIAALDTLPAADFTPGVIRRVRERWEADVVRRDDAEAAAAELHRCLAAVEEARDVAQRRSIEAETTLSTLRTLAEQRLGRVERALEQEAQSRIAATVEARDWERQAHLTHAQLEAVTTSTAWRATGPARAAVTSLRRARSRVAVLRGQVNRRRLASAFDLLRHVDIATIRQRFSAVYGTAMAAAGLSVAVERGPLVPVVQTPWPGDQPLVSVVITCFNYGRYVEDAVRSVLAQTLKRVEVIVVDGGSTDGTTIGVLERLQRDVPGVRVLFREGAHLVGDNRNHGISMAKGRYVCCLDADDAIRPIYLEMATYLLEVHDYDVVSTSTRTFGLREESFGVLPRPVLADLLLANNLSTVAVFRRSMWQDGGGFHDTGKGPEHIYEDWKFWVRLAALGARVINITGDQLFLYRVHGEQSLSNLVGTPGMQQQRRAIAAFNEDVVDDAALERSQRRREEVHQVTNAFVNLCELPSPDMTTVLITMPFLIVGGAERLLGEITRHLGARGFRLIIVTTLPVDVSFGDTSDWFAGSTAEIYHLPRLLDVDRWESFLDYLVVCKHVDVLWQVGSAFVYAMLPALRARHPHLKVVDLLFNTTGHAAANRTHAADIDLTFVENAEVERWLLAEGERPDRIMRAESGVDLEIYTPSRGHRRGDSLRVGFSGRFAEEKDPLAFLAIAAAIGPRKDIEFVMTGAGPLEGEVRAALGARGLQGRVSILGVVDDIRAHLGALDVLVLPSKLDGRPVVVLEALALGVPVVASAVGALPDLVQDGVTGYLCEPGDHAGFAARLLALADDRDAHEEMGRAARRFAERHLDAKVMFECYETTLRKLVSDGVGQRP